MKHLLRQTALTLAMLLVATAAFAYPPGFAVHHGDRETKRVAITIDDCWDFDVLRAMHELCVKYNVPVTWFVLGRQFKVEDREMWQGIIDHGSEIGNHLYNHIDLTTNKAYYSRNMILLSQERLDQTLGYHYPLRLLRPPYGNVDNASLNLLEEYGVEKVILWDVSNTNVQGAFSDTQNGSILLFHTNYADLRCLEELIPMLLDAGYELVTVSELLGLEPLETSEELYVFPY